MESVDTQSAVLDSLGESLPGHKGGNAWLRFRLLERQWVHLWPCNDRRMVAVVESALDGCGMNARKQECEPPEQGIIVLAADHPLTPALLRQLRAQDATRLLPIALFGDREASAQSYADGSDAWLASGPASLLQTLLELEIRMEKVNELPEPEELTAGERRELDLLRFLYSRDVTELGPHPDPESPIGFRYPLAELLLGVSPLETVQTLEEFRQAGILEGQVQERIYLCRTCGSVRMSIREICPSCRVPSLLSQAVIHHFRCAHVGPTASYQRNGQLVCPKCDTRLHHIGVDYDKPGTEQRCERCHSSWLEGLVEARCLACDTRSEPERARLLDLRAFRPLPALQRAAMRTAPPLSSAGTLLRSYVQPSDPVVYQILREQAERVCRRYGRPASVIRLEIEDLRELQDRIGRTELRRLLNRITQALRQLIRTCDVVGMDESDAIEILLIETELDGAEAVLGRLGEAWHRVSQDRMQVAMSVAPLVPDAGRE